MKWVKENDLVHGEWEKWLLNNVNFSDRQARRFIQAYEEFKMDDIVRFGNSKVFEILQLPESIDRQNFIQQSHIISSTGEEKTVEDMTVKELREVKKQLKEAEDRTRQLELDLKIEKILSQKGRVFCFLK